MFLYIYSKDSLLGAQKPSLSQSSAICRANDAVLASGKHLCCPIIVSPQRTVTIHIIFDADLISYAIRPRVSRTTATE